MDGRFSPSNLLVTLLPEKICRLCTANCPTVIPIFGDDTEFASKIQRCLQIQLSPDDVLPKGVCKRCFAKVNEYSEFFSLCSKSQESLMDLFGREGINSGLEPPFESIDILEDSLTDKDQSALDLSSLENDDESFSGEPAPVDCSTLNPNEPEEDQLKEKGNSPKKKSVTQTLDSETNGNTSGQGNDVNSDGESDDDIFVETVSSTKTLFADYIWQCSLCDKTSPALSFHKSHYSEEHGRAADFTCTKCRKVYNRYRSFARHVKLHADPKRYACDICGKRFSQKTVLQSHSTVHTDERPHVCPECGKAFKQFSSLYLHSRCHLPDQAKPSFTCTICKKRLSSKHSMENHLKTHTGERNFVCDICGKRFLAKGSLDYHIMTHDEAKRHACSECGKRFKTARLLSKHALLHTGVKPHQCDVCGKQFRVRSALKEHDRIHTGEMPYSCEFCGKAFRFKGILTVHRRQHTGERPYSCGECLRTFTNWANYNKHLKRRHKMTASQDSGSSLAQYLTSDLIEGESDEIPAGVESLSTHDVFDDLSNDSPTSLFKSLPPNVEHEIFGVSSGPGTIAYYMNLHTLPTNILNVEKP